MVRKKAITLPSSKKVYGHDDGSFNERTLVTLLKEAWTLNLEDNDKIVTLCEYIPDNFPDDTDPTEFDLRLKKEIVTYKDLKDTYERYFGKYSPEEEKQRSDFQFALLEKQGERRSAWGYYSQAMNYANAIEEAKQEEKMKQEHDEEGLKELREKRKHKGNMLQIG